MYVFTVRFEKDTVAGTWRDTKGGKIKRRSVKVRQERRKKKKEHALETEPGRTGNVTLYEAA